MNKYNLKKYLNKKVYTLSNLYLKKKNTEQTLIDDVLENLDETDESFNDLEEAKEFLKNNKRSLAVTTQQLEQLRKKKGAKQKRGAGFKWFLFGILTIIGLIIFWKYFHKIIAPCSVCLEIEAFVDIAAKKLSDYFPIK